jgi:hypothetical protein
MLQINSGKLFTRGVGRTNHLRGVLYSNLQLRHGYNIVTAAGTLLETDDGRRSRAIVFEMDERIEAAEEGPGFLISHTIAPYLLDFSALATFGLQALVSPDSSLVEQLTSDAPGFSSYNPPRYFLRRYFDDRITLAKEQIQPFCDLVDQLIALERRHYLAAMRAIKTFVAGLHRMRDDLALAYTLMVSSVESLAQEFDGHGTAWTDIDERKRTAVDVALKQASATTAAKVRAAILSTEHSSLARRYRAFVTLHIDHEYFCEPHLAVGGGIARHEIDEALRQAYALRSRYVHNLLPLPDAIELGDSNREVTELERRPALTFQGLVRLTRHVIAAFIASSPKVKVQPYNYVREQAGVVTVSFAAEVWVGAPLKTAAHAKQRLEGLLDQLVSVLARDGKSVTDLRPIFSDIERLAKSSKAHRTTLLNLYALFAYSLLSEEERPLSLDALFHRHMHELSAPSSEGLVMRTLFDTLEGWPVDVHEKVVDSYFSQRVKPGGLHAPKVLNAAFCLALAERHRQAKDISKAEQWLARAVETFPGHVGIRSLETNFSPRRRIKWREVLLPRSARRKPKRNAAPSP